MNSPGGPRARGRFSLRAKLAWTTAVWLLTLFALGIRFSGIGARLPARLNADEHVFVEQAELMKSGGPSPELDPRFGFYPQLVPRLCLLTPFGESTAEPQSLSEHLSSASHEIIWMRTVVALLSILIVPGTYLLARRFLERPPALLAAGLVSASLLHQWYSSQARPHGAAAALALLSILAALEVRRRGDARAYLFAGLAIGLSVGTLQSGLLALPALVLAHFLRNREGSRHPHAWLLCSIAILALSVRVFYPFLFAQAAPGVGLGDHVLAVGGPDDEFSGHHLLGATDVSPARFRGRGFGILVEGLLDYDPWIFALAVLGLSVWLIALARRGTGVGSDDPRRRDTGARVNDGHMDPAIHASIRPSTGGWIGARIQHLHDLLRGREDLAIVLSYVLPYFLVFGLYEATHPRYSIPLLPYLACSAAFGVWCAARALAGIFPLGRWQHTVVGTTLLVAFGVQATVACKVSLVSAAPDTASRAADWIETHLDPQRDRIAVVPSLELPLLRKDAALTGRPREIGSSLDPWIVYQSKLVGHPRHARTWSILTLPFTPPESLRAIARDPARELRAMQAEYVVIEVYQRPIYDDFLAGVRAACDRVARFSPRGFDGDRIDRTQPDAVADAHVVTPDITDRRFAYGALVRTAMQVESLGTAIEIYRLRSPVK